MKLLKSTPKQKKRQGRARKGDGSLKLRGKTWWYRIPDPNGGKPIEKSCETGDYNSALLVKQQALVESSRPKQIAGGKFLIGDVLADYMLYAERECPGSIVGIRSMMKSITKFFGNILTCDLTTAHGDRYRTHRTIEGAVINSTVNRELAYLIAALNYEREATPSRVASVPFMRMVSEDDRVREGFIYRRDYEKILAQLPATIKPLFVCGFHTGARSGELKKIRWEMVDFERMIIELAPKTTKNRSGRYIPIWGDMKEYLLQQKQIRDSHFPDCPWVFFWHPGYQNPLLWGKRIGHIDASFKAACVRAGYPTLLFHDLRRSAIRFADQDARMSSTRVKMMSGHKSDAVYKRYNIVGATDMQSLGQDLDEYLKNSKKKVVPIRRRA